MSVENPSENQAGEKSARELSVEELQALLAQKQAEQQPVTEAAVDTSYVEMAEGKLTTDAGTAQAEAQEQEQLAEQITEEEGKLKANIEELGSAASQADAAFVKAEEALEADPHAVEPKLTLEKINDAYEKVKRRIENVAATIGLGGMATMAGAMITDAIFMSDKYGSGFTELNPQVHEVALKFLEGGMAAASAGAAIFMIGRAINTFRQDKQKSRYFAQQSL
jgi:hypothetical protein